MSHSSVLKLDANSVIIPPDSISPTVRHALTILQRDMRNVFGRMPLLAPHSSGAAIVIEYADDGDQLAERPEGFAIRFTAHNLQQLHIVGSDDLGIMYGVLHVSRAYLGVDPLWFWADLEPEPQSSIQIPRQNYVSPVPKVRYRGWFVNDETCFFEWKGYPPGEDLWLPIFETLLRLGGNMIIPGTDLPREGAYWALAADMGLWFTHHHVEALGADLFSRRFPDKEPSYDEYPDLFEALWREAIVRQRDNKVVWVLGFRGQGDHPFWEDDPSCSTPEKRGAVIAEVIQRQYDVLCEYIENPVCCTYIYGELTELYRDGHLRLPKGAIKIWSDNGYGRMVSRRQWLENPRLPSLPKPEDVGPHGLYFHVAFHDLQASNHLTMTPSPDLVRRELAEAFKAGANEYLMLNTGIIRPHLYLLDLVARMWMQGNADVHAHRLNFTERLFPNSYATVEKCYQRYFDAPFQSGPHDDEKVGDEFYHHSIRPLITAWIRGLDRDTCPDLTWATGNIGFAEQIEWCRQKCTEGLEQWGTLLEEYSRVFVRLSGREKRFFQDNLITGAMLHYSGCEGTIAFCESYQAFQHQNLPLAFLLASQALWAYQEGVEAMEKAEHGQWKNFYQSDWTNNVRMTIYSLDTLRRYIRALGDNERFTAWSNDLVWRITGDQKIQYKPMTDDELAKAFEKIKVR